jgi:hypothetical protein
MKSIAHALCSTVALFAIAHSVTGGRPSSAGEWVYWADSGTDSIRRVRLDGSDMQILYTGTQGVVFPKDVALDVTHGYVYWTMGVSPGSNKIQRAALDGTGTIETLLAPGYFLGNIELDVDGGKMYWAKRAGTGKIVRSNLDGSDVQDLLNLNAPTALALDLAAGKLYWGLTPSLSCLNEAKIQKSNLDGSDVEDVILGLKFISALAIDAEAGKIYWSEECENEINRANLDGSGPVDFLIANTSFGIDLDPNDGMIYWTTPVPSINRSNLDGSEVDELITIGADSPMGLALLVDKRASDPADLNDDGVVNGIDLAILLGAWGRCPPKAACDADLNGNGTVNGIDLAMLLSAWTA